MLRIQLPWVSRKKYDRVVSEATSASLAAVNNSTLAESLRATIITLLAPEEATKRAIADLSIPR